MINVEWVKGEVAKIAEGLMWDSEAAHIAEDDLHQAVLRAIAEGNCDDPAACAREALTTLNLRFERWCA